MSIAITIQNRQRTKRLNVVLLKRITISLLKEQLGLGVAELGVSLVADAEMTRINEHFLRHKGSTDVITFDHAERQSRNAKSATEINGELFICVDEAIRQAKRFRTTWQSEIVRYIVHGVLHLLGQDDKKPAARIKMKRAENRLVTALRDAFPFTKLGVR